MDPEREEFSESTKLTLEVILFILGIIALAIGLYFIIFHYDELPEYPYRHGYHRRAWILPLLPGIILMIVSRTYQNMRRGPREIIGPPAESSPEPRKKKTYKWED